MNGRDRVKERLPVAIAFAEGKDIQSRSLDSEDAEYHNYDASAGCPDIFSSYYEWRIKPDPEEYYRIKWANGEWSTCKYSDVEDALEGMKLSSYDYQKSSKIFHVREVIDDES